MGKSCGEVIVWMLRRSGEVKVKSYDTDMHASLLNINYRRTQRLTGVTGYCRRHSARVVLELP